MKDHNTLRRMAAELRQRELADEGIETELQFKMEQTGKGGIPRRDCPVLFAVDDLRAHQRAVANYDERSGFPPPVDPQPIVDFSAWSYYPRCPKCNGRRIEVEGYNEGAVPTPETRAWCLRPKVGGRGDCGWEGANAEVNRQCLACGETRGDVEDGVCSLCNELGVDVSYGVVRLFKAEGWAPVPGTTRYKRGLSHHLPAPDGEGEGELLVAERIADAAVVVALDEPGLALAEHEADMKAELASKVAELADAMSGGA